MTAGDLVALMLLRDGLGGKVDHVLVLKDDEVQVLDDQWVRGGLGAADHDEIVDLAVKILLAGGRPLRVHFAVRRLDVTPPRNATSTVSSSIPSSGCILLCTIFVFLYYLFLFLIVWLSPT